MLTTNNQNSQVGHEGFWQLVWFHVGQEQEQERQILYINQSICVFANLLIQESGESLIFPCLCRLGKVYERIAKARNYLYNNGLKQYVKLTYYFY